MFHTFSLLTSKIFSSNLIEHHIIKPETPIIPTIATSGEGVGEGLLTLLHMIKK